MESQEAGSPPLTTGSLFNQAPISDRDRPADIKPSWLNNCCDFVINKRSREQQHGRNVSCFRMTSMKVQESLKVFTDDLHLIHPIGIAFFFSVTSFRQVF